jgi:hypothetical protein
MPGPTPEKNCTKGKYNVVIMLFAFSHKHYYIASLTIKKITTYSDDFLVGKEGL